MSSVVEWGADGTPRSPRFDDVYRPPRHGLEQARHVFLTGCCLPQAWAAQPLWTIFETGFGLGLNFLATWQAWRDDPNRPRILHFVSIEAWPVTREDILRSAAEDPELVPLGEALARECYGLLPGFHRLAFDGGRVLLTLCIGDVHDALKQQSLRADCVFLDGFDPQCNPQMWDADVIKGVSRLCRRGAKLATWTVVGEVRRLLAEQGFDVVKADGLPPKRHCLRATYDPHWQPKGLSQTTAKKAAKCVVVGAGLAGAAVASSLARRGWQVTVIDAAPQPASGASSLPAGLLAPHQSPDDNLLSRLSRAGVRMTLGEASARLQAGRDWERSGVMEQRLDDQRSPPHESEWTRPMPDANAWWHEAAAWIRPAALVEAWLAQPRIEFRGSTNLTSLDSLAEFDLVVIAAAHASAALLGDRIALNPVRGQVSWGRRIPDAPPYPVNGNGHFIPKARVEGEVAWLSGSTYGRGDASREVRNEDHAANLQRLRELVPEVAAQLEPQFAGGEVNAWTGVRCASTDRRPLVGRIDDRVWASTAMGSRGLTFALLCAELLAARLHGEPLPLEPKLADALDVRRQLKS